MIRRNLLESHEILLGGDVKHIRANLGSRRMLGELCRPDGEVEQGGRPEGLSPRRNKSDGTPEDLVYM
jgi:hypothetical protein